MKIAVRFVLIFAVIFLTQNLFAQSKKAESNLATIKQNEWKKDLSQYKTHQDFIKSEKTNLGIASVEDLKLDRVVETKGNWKHTKYQQQYKAIPVLNGVYILHEKGDVLRKASGNVLPNINVKTTPNFNANQAVEYAKLEALDLTAKENNGQLPEGLTFETIENSTPELVVADKQYPRNSGEYTLAYTFELEFNSFPPRHDQYIFDALSGNIIDIIPQVCQIHVDGKVKTRYYGEKSVVVDSIAPGEYLLQDFTRGKGIVTINDYTGLPFTSDSSTFDLKNDFDDDAAGDAHWAASRYFDWLRDSFGFNSIDNDGHELRSVIHLNEGESVVNAFWNGRFATFGDGDCTGYGPLTSIDVVSHEFTHGLTRFNSGMVYRYESGGLNESMSDMFGKGLEYYLNPAGFTWQIAHDFRIDTTENVFRNMADPNTRNHPKFYKGRFWSSAGEAVHTNSNVMNHWFYLLVEGGDGNNENGDAFNVEQLGMDKTMQIVFTIQTAYLVPNSDYYHAYQSTLEVAADLWGIDSWEYTAVVNAWYAVGISVAEEFTLDRDLAIHLLNKDTVICGANSTKEISIELENLSNADLPAGTEIELGFRLISDAGAESSGRFTQIFVLDNDFLMGEKLPLTFREPISFGGTTGNRERIEVYITNTFQDQNAINNNDRREVFVTEYDIPDAVIQLRRVGDVVCAPDQFTLQIDIRNEGCEVIPMGTEMKIDLQISSKDTSITFMLPNDLNQNNVHRENLILPISITENGAFQYSATLDFIDANSNNNSTTGQSLLLKKSPNDYSENFDDFDLNNDPNLFLDKSGKTITRLVEYNGEQMLGFSGTSPGSNAISRDCQNLRKILQEHEGYDSKAQICVDMSGMNDPTLSFDLTQFTIENNYNIPKEFSSIFTVSTSDPGFEPIMIMDQNEGEVVRHNIQLPQDFDGQITLNSFTLFGSIVAFAQGNYEQGNVHLLDNIQITNGPTSTSELSDNQYVNVFPNPAKDLVWFENKSTDFTNFNIEIYNTLGAKIHEIRDANGRTEWQINGQPAGVYFYKISSRGEWLDAGKLILEQ